MQKINLHLNS